MTDDCPVPHTLRNDEWPPDYVKVFRWRQLELVRLRKRPELWQGAREYYFTHPEEWINHWAVTYDPRVAGRAGELTLKPFILFQRQGEFIQFLHEALRASVSALCEKSRDMGVTWLCCAFSVWLWLYWDGAAVGWGSRKAELVDDIGVPDSIFEKLRVIIANLPPEMLPEGFSPFNKTLSSLMKIVNPVTGATITGEGGDNIGRGGRKLIFFSDEAAHLEHPEMVESSLSNNTNVQVDISSVNGPATVFQRKRDSGVDWKPGMEMRRDCSNNFIFDWTDHPEKSPEWYERERKKKEDAGLLHIFAQEVDRNPSAAVQGTIIPDAWVRAAIGAAQKLGIEVTGGWRGALDPADEGGDLHAFGLRHGIELHSIRDWGEGDVGEATRIAIGEAKALGGPIEIDYDSVGVGAGVKSEANRLVEEKLMPKGIRFIAWQPAAAPRDPEGRVEPHDKDSPLNKDFYHNFKAQGWWELRRRFERTYRALNETGYTYDPDELISINPEIPQPILHRLRKELTQVTRKQTPSMKMVIDKKPEGAKSPNMGDATMMLFWPANARRPMVINSAVVARSFMHRNMSRRQHLLDAGRSFNDY